MGVPANVKPELPRVGRIPKPIEIIKARTACGLSRAEAALLAEVEAAAVDRLEDLGVFRVGDALRLKHALAAWGHRFRPAPRRGRGSL